MPDEPNQRMDRLLRGYAEKRRGAPDSPLHPATRRMLQDEARRVHGTAAARRAGWRAWWPQIAFGCALVLVIGLAAAVLRGGPRERQLAKVEQADEQRSSANVPRRQALPTEATRPADADLPALQPPLYQEKKVALSEAEPAKELAKAKDYAISPEQLAAVAAPALILAEPPAAKAEEPAAPQPVTVAANARPAAPAANYGRSIATPAEAVAVRLENAARVNELTNLGAARRRRFVQTNATPGPVLRSFQLEQLGGQIRFLDLDGSVYSGEIDPVASAQLAAPSAAAGPAAAYSFRATGLNLTLGRPVNFQGQLYDRTNLSLTSPASPIAANPEPERLPRRAAPPPARASIVGKALIGGTNETPVNAVSIQR